MLIYQIIHIPQSGIEISDQKKKKPPLHLSQNTYKTLDTRRQSLEHKLLHPVANELLKYRMWRCQGCLGYSYFQAPFLVVPLIRHLVKICW